MTVLTEDIDIIKAEIDKLINNEDFKEAYEKYKYVDSHIENIKDMISLSSDKDEKQAIAEFYSSYAYFLFSCGEYATFFEIYIKAQKYGYSSEERRQFIYNSFIEPNIEVMKSNYTKNMEKMKSKGFSGKAIEFDTLTYWLITTGNKNEYYVYDKETDCIRNKISLNINNTDPYNFETSKVSSDYLLIENRDEKAIYENISEVISSRKRIYVIMNDRQELLSYFQGFLIDDKLLDKLTIFDNEGSFKQYFTNNSNYLPRTILGSSEDIEKYQKIIEEIHQYRLTDEGRSGDNILLSICMPSYNRGKRAYDNVIHTLKSELDEEIEIVLSNSGSNNENQAFYEDIDKIDDSRISYFKFDINEGFSLSAVCRPLKLGRGKYVLLLSDEDLLDLNELKSVVDIIKSSEKNISVIRPKSDGQIHVPFIGIKEAGKDAMYTFMLTSTYFSGTIYNKQLLREYKMIEYVEKNQNNPSCCFYPQMILEILLSQYGSILGLDNILIKEGQAENISHPQVDIGKKEIYNYATIESRIDQHKGWFDVIKELKITEDNFKILRELYMIICRKTRFLIDLSIRVFYSQDDESMINKKLEEISVQMIEYLERVYKEDKNDNGYWYSKDIEEIRSYYNHQ